MHTFEDTVVAYFQSVVDGGLEHSSAKQIGIAESILQDLDYFASFMGLITDFAVQWPQFLNLFTDALEHTMAVRGLKVPEITH